MTDRFSRPYPSPFMDDQTSAAPAENSRSNGEPLLKLEDLCTYFHTDEGVVKSVNGVSYEARPGETVGVVGESGCGKSVTALSIMRLIPMPPGKIESGSIWFDGEDLVRVSNKRMREIRGGKIGMIFQEPMTSLNPVMTVGEQVDGGDQDPPRGLPRGKEAQEAHAPAASAKVEHPRRPSSVVRTSIPMRCRGGMKSARDDRDGARLQPEAADRGRADHGAGRDHPGADPRPPAQASSEDPRHVHPLIITHDLGVIAEIADTASP